MSALETTVFYVNPAAGGGRAGAVWRQLCQRRPELAARAVEAADQAGGRAALDRALAGGAGRLIAVGGDGTVHLVANHLLAADAGARVALGLVPAGTGSDLARTLALPRRPAAALAHALAAVPRPIDALAITTDNGVRRYVVNIASLGISGAVDLAVNAIANRGAATYLLATLAALVRYRPLPCRVEVDGAPFYDGPFFVAAVANGRSFGKGMRVAPDAIIDDGLADVVLVPPVPLWTLPWRLPQFLTGRHVRLPMVKTTRARTVRLVPRAPMPPFDLDGETLPSGPATVELLPAALRFLF